MARSLSDARRQVAEDLADQVDELTAPEAILEDHPYWAKVADGKALRGIPALSRNSAGSAVNGTQPGWNLFGENDE